MRHWSGVASPASTRLDDEPRSPSSSCRCRGRRARAARRRGGRARPAGPRRAGARRPPRSGRGAGSARHRFHHRAPTGRTGDLHERPAAPRVHVDHAGQLARVVSRPATGPARGRPAGRPPARAPAACPPRGSAPAPRPPAPAGSSHPARITRHHGTSEPYLAMTVPTPRGPPRPAARRCRRTSSPCPRGSGRRPRARRRRTRSGSPKSRPSRHHRATSVRRQARVDVLDPGQHPAGRGWRRRRDPWRPAAAAASADRTPDLQCTTTGMPRGQLRARPSRPGTRPGGSPGRRGSRRRRAPPARARRPARTSARPASRAASIAASSAAVTSAKPGTAPTAAWRLLGGTRHTAELVVVDQRGDRRRLAAHRALGVGAHRERVPGLAQRVVHQQPPDERLALPDDELDAPRPPAPTRSPRRARPSTPPVAQDGTASGGGGSGNTQR